MSSPRPAPPGWYRHPEGGQRYWDGTAWSQGPIAPPSWPPGWYPDPEGSGRKRHWDGRAWQQTTDRLIRGGWYAAILFPIAGLVIGIVLSTRGEGSTGAVMIAISIVVGVSCGRSSWGSRLGLWRESLRPNVGARTGGNMRSCRSREATTDGFAMPSTAATSRPRAVRSSARARARWVRRPAPRAGSRFRPDTCSARRTAQSRPRPSGLWRSARALRSRRVIASHASMVSQPEAVTRLTRGG